MIQAFEEAVVGMTLGGVRRFCLFFINLEYLLTDAFLNKITIGYTSSLINS